MNVMSWPEQDDRVFITIPDSAPEWLRDQMPPTGSSGKADFVAGGSVWVNWGGGLEGWVPLAWLGDAGLEPEADVPAIIRRDLDAAGRRYRASLAEGRAARAALVAPVQRALSAGMSKSEVARRSGVPRPDLYKRPWRPSP